MTRKEKARQVALRQADRDNRAMQEAAPRLADTEERQRRLRAHQTPQKPHVPIFDDPKEEDVAYFEPVETGAIIPPELPQGAKFDITSAMIHLLNLKGVFAGLPTNDTNMHVMNFVGVCTSYNLPGVDQEAICLRLFPFFLTGETTLWLAELPRGSITT